LQYCYSTVTAENGNQITTNSYYCTAVRPQLNKLVRTIVYSTYQHSQCSGRDRPTQLHSREQAHSERYLSFRLSGEPSSTCRRTTRYTLRIPKKSMLNVPLSQWRIYDFRMEGNPFPSPPVTPFLPSLHFPSLPLLRSRPP